MVERHRRYHEPCARLFWLPVLVFAFVGCGSESDGGGSGGSASGGAAGSSTGGAGGPSGSSHGGAAGSSTGGAAGSSTGGAAGSSTGGAAGSGGSAGEVILKVDFEPAPVGPYTKSAMDLEWSGLKWAQGLSEGRVDIIEGAEAHSGHSLRILYPKGGVGPGEGGAQWLVDLPKSFDELYVSYWVKFGTGFDFVKGGKIPGLGGGANNTGGNKPDGTDGWSGRMMWRTGGDAVQYLYHPDQPTIYGEDLSYDIGGQRVFTPGQWVQVEHHFVMNTPGSTTASWKPGGTGKRPWSARTSAIGTWIPSRSTSSISRPSLVVAARTGPQPKTSTPTSTTS